MQRIIDAIRDHFWGTIAGTFVTAITCTFFNGLEKADILTPLFEQLKMAFDTYNALADIVGTFGLIMAIPSGIIFLAGLLFGKYK